MARAVNARCSIAVVMLTLDQREMTLAGLASLRRVMPANVRIVLWDNASSDGTADAVRSAFPDVLVHQHDRNLGVASGRNAGAELAIRTCEPEFLLFLDNDMVLEPGFVEGLLEPFLSDGKVGQTQAKLRFMSDPSRLNDGGGARITFWKGRVRPIGYGEVDRGQYDTPAPCVACGGAMMVRATLFQELGGFDPVFDPFGPEDLDFSLRLQRRGWRAVYSPRAVAYHKVSHTFESGRYSARYARHKSRHWLLLLRRHASLPERLMFFCLGAPYSIVRLVVREGRRGNLGAVLGTWRGLLDAGRTEASRSRSVSPGTSQRNL